MRLTCSYKYLGSIVTEDISSSKELRTRIVILVPKIDVRTPINKNLRKWLVK